MVDTDDTRRTMDDVRQTPWVWHKLPTGELKMSDDSKLKEGQASCYSLCKHIKVL